MSGAVSCRAHAWCRVMIFFPRYRKSTALWMIQACARVGLYAYRVPISKGNPSFLVFCIVVFVFYMLSYKIRVIFESLAPWRSALWRIAACGCFIFTYFLFVRSLFLTLCAEPISTFHSTSAVIMKILAFCGGASNTDVCNFLDHPVSRSKADWVEELSNADLLVAILASAREPDLIWYLQYPLSMIWNRTERRNSTSYRGLTKYRPLEVTRSFLGLHHTTPSVMRFQLKYLREQALARTRSKSVIRLKKRCGIFSLMLISRSGQVFSKIWIGSTRSWTRKVLLRQS